MDLETGPEKEPTKKFGSDSVTLVAMQCKEEGLKQKASQRSLRLCGGQNVFKSLPR